MASTLRDPWLHLFKHLRRGRPKRLRVVPIPSTSAPRIQAGERDLSQRQGPQLPLDIVADKNPVITVQRTTVVRVAIVALVLAAVGVATAIGLAIGSKSSPPSNKSARLGDSTSTANVSTTTSPPTTTTTTTS